MPQSQPDDDPLVVTPASRDDAMAEPEPDLHVGAIQSLRDENRRLRRTLESIADGLLSLDRDWRYSYFSDAGARLLGMRPEQLIGHSVWELFPKAAGTRFHDGFHRAVETRQPVHFEEYYAEPLHKWIECHCYPSDDGLTVYFRDVTDRKRATLNSEFLNRLDPVLIGRRDPDAMLRHTLTALRAHVGADMVALCDMSPDGQSAQVHRLRAGEEQIDLLTVSLADFLAPDTQAALARGCELVVADICVDPRTQPRCATYYEVGVLSCAVVPLTDGTELKALLAIGGAGQRDWRADEVQVLRGVAARLFPAVARARAERALREGTTLLHAISDGSPDVIFAKDLAGRMRFANPATLALIGKSMDQVIGRTDAEFLDDKEAARRVMDTDRQVMQSGTAIDVEEIVPLPDGTERVWLSHKAPYVDAEGRVSGLLGLSRDITDHKQAEASLRAANQRLVDADRRKNEFIAVLSHELRNPIAPIRFAVPLLRGETLGAIASEAVDVVERQTAQLARLIDDLLDVARITRGMVELRREHMTLASAVSAALETAAPTIEAAGLGLDVELDADPVWLHADATRVSQILTNLLDNAAKYTSRNGRVTVRAGREAAPDGGDQAVVRVRDSGIGIPPEELPTIFDMFRQVNRNDAGSVQGGLGIGLGLVRQLVEMHGGSIEALSDGLGLGAEFVVRLPTVAPPAAGGDVAPAPGVAGGGTRALRVLVVDDNADLVEMLSYLIAGFGHDVSTAEDGASAVTTAVAFRPDVVLLDVGLPVMTGFDVARALRRHRDTSAAYLVAMTGWGQPEDRERTREAGFDHHLTKPAGPDVLEALLARIVPRD